MSMNSDHLSPSILRRLNPSPEQIKPILQRGNDIVVTAGAGTGKTRTLVSRYLSLLAEGNPLRSIVAITFTKKAAREMRNRIREEVRVFLQDSDLDQDDLIFWQSIYENLDAARISTIHSLAGDILRQHPAEIGLDPMFELLDEGQSARLKAQAIEAALAWGSGDQQAAVIFPLYGAWKLRRVVGELLAKRLDVQAALDDFDDDIWQSWLKKLISPMQTFIEEPEVVEVMAEFLSYEEEGLLQRAQEMGDLFADDLRIVNNYWKKIQEAKADGDWLALSRCLGPFRDHLKQKGKKENWAPGNPRELVKAIQPIFDENIKLDQIDLEVDRKLAQEIIPGIKAVFRYAISWYDNAKNQITGLDFDDLEDLSLKLLQGFPRVKSYWQDQISALLVDEYQDTNARQRELVNALNADGQRLFIVGDGKQSIYKFRGADVAVFREEQDKIRVKGSSYQLSTSYRAHPALINTLNSLLQPILGLDKAVPYIEPFSPLLPGRVSNPLYHGEPYLELHLAAGTNADGAGRTAVEVVASRIREIVEEADSGISREVSKRVNYGDVAVLCRASSSFPLFEAAFEKAGIPYLTIAGQGFYDRPEIRDLLNALAAFADFHNDLAVAGLMRSPVMGFPDDVLLQCRDLQRQSANLSLFGTVKENVEVLKDEDKLRAGYLISLIEKYSNLVNRISAADILSRFIEESGYIAAMAVGGYHRNIQNIKKLVADAQNSGVVGVVDFLNTIAELRNAAVREGEAAEVTEGAVQIMTVHQAKGLEFPIVVLGDASKKERLGRDIVIDPDFGLIPPLTETRIIADDPKKPELRTVSSLAYEIALERDRAKEAAESDRLFYVAATRAQDLLIISGVLGKLNKDQTLGKLGGWLEKTASVLGLRELPLAFQVDGDATYRYDVDRNGIQARIMIYENQVDLGLAADHRIRNFDLESDFGDIPALVQDSWRQSVPVEPGAISMFRAASPVTSTTAPARIVGDVVHQALRLWKFPDQGENEFIEWAISELKCQGLSREGLIKNGYRRIKKILERFQDHELFNRMSKAERVLHEVPYSLKANDGSIFSGIIDALVFENGSWIIVEFKTDEIRDEKRFEWVWQHEDYQHQVDQYIRAVHQILGEKPQAVLCFLDYQEGVHLLTADW